MHESLSKDRIYAAVDVLFLTVRQGKLWVLLSRREREPQRGRWALPGKLLELDESALEAAEALKEEMLPGGYCYFEQLYTFTSADRDERGRVISIAYVGIAPHITPTQDEKLFEIDLKHDGSIDLRSEDGIALDPALTAFDHAYIIETGVKRLRGKIDYTDIGLRFIRNKESFTLGELEEIFEAVKGEGADKSNFRRFVKNRFEDRGIISPKDGTDKQSRGRPARLYSANI
ncbi:MAG: NUDIX hydrolase [Clostridia bacterium]|nr:NUDIX hydrolase [Clostridia bacterium]